MSVFVSGAKQLVCTMCGQRLRQSEATVASSFADGQLAFAHEVHRTDRSAWWLFWQRFNTEPFPAGTRGRLTPPTQTVASTVERRSAGRPADLASDLARHLQTRSAVGMAVVVADRPLSMLSVIRKHWNRTMRAIQIRRASTLDAVEIARLTAELARMQVVRFTVSADLDDSDVLIVGPGELNTTSPLCGTLYLCSDRGLDSRRFTEGTGKLIVEYTIAAVRPETTAVNRRRQFNQPPRPRDPDRTQALRSRRPQSADDRLQ